MKFPDRAPRGASGAAPPLRAIYVRYMTFRILIFLATLAVVILLGASGFLALILALVVSGLLSYPLALRQRRAVVEAIENRRRR